MAHRRCVAIVINLNWTMKHHQEIFAGTQLYAREHGWDSILCPYPPDLTTKKDRNRFHGIIGRINPELATQANRARIPLVNVWGSSPVGASVPSVIPDDFRAGQMAAEHLMARGYRSFAYVGYSRVNASRKLEAGYRNVIQSEGLRPLSHLLVPATFSDSKPAWDRFQDDLKRWVGQLDPLVGVLAVNDKVARYVATAAMDAGWTIPSNMAVVGMENEEVVCLNPEPSLSSIELGFHEVGVQAASLLESMMNGEAPTDNPVLIPPVGLIPRASSDAYHADNVHVAKALRFIADECHRPVNVEDVVAHVPISWRSLERHFKEHRGSTIRSEIVHFRIERAKHLLIETELLIKQVAESCGFKNTRRLCEVFKRVEGISPAAYRVQHRYASARAKTPGVFPGRD